MDEIIRRARAALPLMLMTGLLVGQVSVAFAHDVGRAGDNRAANGCGGACHSGGTAGTTVVFGMGAGSLPTSVAANSVNTFTFKISGGPASNAGLSVSASAGTLAVTTTDSTVGTTGELFHTAASPMVAGSKTYTFTWTAPAMSGPVTFTGAGVSGNADGSTTLDGAARVSASVNVTGGANVAPIARITGPSTGTVGAAVSFDGSTSSDADGTIATYLWNFGDNTAGATATPPAHTYATAGTFHVTLIVTDNLGLVSATTTHDIVISAVGTHQPPVAKAGGPYTGTVGTAVVFSGSTSTVDTGLVASYSWNFGDNSALATVANPSHTYSTAGTFTVTLKVTDNAAIPLSTTITTNATISAVTPPTPPPASTGQALYVANCESCHGPKAGPAGPAKSVVGESASDIHEAIQEVPTMQSLSTLSNAEVTAIAIYLKEVSKGEQLYIDNCESCHGVGGTGGTKPAVRGASKTLIKTEIQTEPEMASLKFLLTQDGAIEAIAKFLALTEDDLVAQDGAAAAQNGAAKDSAAKDNAVAAGALDWLTLMGVGAWRLSRRRKK